MRTKPSDFGEQSPKHCYRWDKMVQVRSLNDGFTQAFRQSCVRQIEGFAREMVRAQKEAVSEVAGGPSRPRVLNPIRTSPLNNYVDV